MTTFVIGERDTEGGATSLIYRTSLHTLVTKSLKLQIYLVHHYNNFTSKTKLPYFSPDSRK